MFGCPTKLNIWFHSNNIMSDVSTRLNPHHFSLNCKIDYFHSWQELDTELDLYKEDFDIRYGSTGLLSMSYGEVDHVICRKP